MECVNEVLTLALFLTEVNVPIFLEDFDDFIVFLLSRFTLLYIEVVVSKFFTYDFFCF